MNNNTNTTNTNDIIKQHEIWVQEAIILELKWIDGGRIPAVMSQTDAWNHSNRYGVEPAGRWVSAPSHRVTRFELAYHITTNRA